ncbi:MAG: hypothetical protein SPL02_00635 [Bacilli bacterium]|nr:hypothetical protein [Bacilli bacterium]MDY6430368.1 hypothetical protein [Bacilli bacterium]
MEEIKCLRFRLIMKIMEPYFASKRIKLLHSNYGFIVFTTEKMHERFKNQGNGQWQDIKDLFYFSLSFNAENRGNMIELFCYADAPIREAWNEKLAGRGQLYSRYTKRGFDSFYQLEIIPERENPALINENTRKLANDLIWFLDNKIIEIENILLN